MLCYHGYSKNYVFRDFGSSAVAGFSQFLSDMEPREGSPPFFGFPGDTQMPQRLLIREEGRELFLVKAKRGRPSGQAPVEIFNLPKRSKSTGPAASASRPPGEQASTSPSRPPGSPACPPSLGVGGTNKRPIIFLLKNAPLEKFGFSKLPKIEALLRVFFHHLLQEPILKCNPNSLTLATTAAVTFSKSEETAQHS